MGDELTKRAAVALRSDHRSYFCINCGRPRTRNYCPWNAKHPDLPEHRVFERRAISLDTQIYYFIKNKEARDTKNLFR